MPTKLTPKKLLFVKYYLAAGDTYQNATQSAIAAGYSKKTAYSAGARLLKNVDVRAEIDLFVTKVCDKLEITTEKVMREYAKLAFVNVKDLYDEQGNMKDIHELDSDVAAAVSQVEINLTEACALKKVKLHDKKGSLDSISKIMGMFIDRVEIDDKSGRAEGLQKARERARTNKKD